jgi:hypothetical protein
MCEAGGCGSRCGRRKDVSVPDGLVVSSQRWRGELLMTYIGKAKKIVQVEPLWLPGEPGADAATVTETAAPQTNQEPVADTFAEVGTDARTEPDARR